MTNARLVVAWTALTLAATLLPAVAATPTPKPAAAAKKTPIPIAIPAAHLPVHALHAEYVVEVNKKGQVVKIKSGVGTSDPTFNTQTFGNAMQIWIRKPDGTATVGLFKVTYDYDPKTKKIARNVSLISEGGSWGDQEGAANAMIETARKEAQAQYELEQKQRAALPSMQQITGKDTPKPSPAPTI